MVRPNVFNSFIFHLQRQVRHNLYHWIYIKVIPPDYNFSQLLFPLHWWIKLYHFYSTNPYVFLIFFICLPLFQEGPLLHQRGGICPKLVVYFWLFGCCVLPIHFAGNFKVRKPSASTSFAGMYQIHSCYFILIKKLKKKKKPFSLNLLTHQSFVLLVVSVRKQIMHLTSLTWVQRRTTYYTSSLGWAASII